MNRVGVMACALGVALCLGACSLFSARDATEDVAEPAEPEEELVVMDTFTSAETTAPDLSTFSGLLAAGQISSIRVLGDSITAGFLIDGFDDPSDTGVVIYSGGEGTYYETPTYVACWTNAFREYTQAHGVGSFVNAGVSGFRMQYLAEDPSAWLGDGADVIVVMLGTNDAAKVSVEEFRAYAEQALLAAQERCRHLVVVSPPNNERTDANNLYDMSAIDEVLVELCAEHGWEHVSLLDVLAIGTDDFYEDQVHPTARGSAKLWEALKQRLSLP